MAYRSGIISGSLGLGTSTSNGTRFNYYGLLISALTGGGAAESTRLTLSGKRATKSGALWLSILTVMSFHPFRGLLA